MARVRWHGAEVRATPLRQQADGSWIMRAEQIGQRITTGSEFIVQPSEIIDGMLVESSVPRSVAAALDTHLTSAISEFKGSPSPADLHEAKMSDTTPNLTGATFLSASTLDAVTKAKARIAKAQQRITDATTRHATASGQMEGIAAVIEQEATNLETAVKTMLPGSNSQ